MINMLDVSALDIIVKKPNSLCPSAREEPVCKD